jgi:glucosamine--fructose-6-phosphate aminotransferase (isomerizing)
MTQEKTLMRRETQEAGSVVASLLSKEAATIKEIGKLFSQRRPSVVTTAARGSSDHAATFFKYLFEISTGLPVASIGPSVASVYETTLQLSNAVHFTVSQSGASPDIVALQRAAKLGGAITVAVVNVVDSPLAHEADLVLGLHAGPEQSVAATKSCIAAAAALAAVTAEVKGDAALVSAIGRLPNELNAATEPAASVVDWLATANSLYISGRGPGFAVALEAALKAKETCGIHAEAFSLAELMHGPMRLVEDGFPIVAFVARDAANRANAQSLEKLSGIGGKILAIGADEGFDRQIVTGSTGHGLIDPLLGLGAYYRLIERVALAKGLNPDKPRNLKKVTETV